MNLLGCSRVLGGMADGKVVVSTEKLVVAARAFAAAAAVFDAARTNFNNGLSVAAYPRPWADDATGKQFGAYYETTESDTKTALDDAVTGLGNQADAVAKMSMGYQQVEQTNSR